MQIQNTQNYHNAQYIQNNNVDIKSNKETKNVVPKNKVEEIKEAIKNNEYQINIKKTAESMSKFYQN